MMLDRGRVDGRGETVGKTLGREDEERKEECMTIERGRREGRELAEGAVRKREERGNESERGQKDKWRCKGTRGNYQRICTRKRLRESRRRMGGGRNGGDDRERNGKSRRE